MTWTDKIKGRMAKLPGLLVPRTGNAEQDRFFKAVAEHLELRAGSRGDPLERAVTVREIDSLKQLSAYLEQPKNPQEGEMALQLGSAGSVVVQVEAFADALRSTRLYRDLMARFDDPNRYNDLPELVRETLLRDLEAEARKRGAAIDEIERIVQDNASSLAMVVREVTAAIAYNAAAVQSLEFSYATDSRAQAGKITNLIASLGNYYQDGTPGRAHLSEDMQVVADRVDGLRAHYVVKMTAGGAAAGFGLAAEEVNGQPSSAFIIQADKFALVRPNYQGGLTNTPDVSTVPFGMDNDGLYLTGAVRLAGSLMVQTPYGRRALADGMRGSVDLYVRNQAFNQSDARWRVYQAIGYTGDNSQNNGLVIGDSVTYSTGSGVNTRSYRYVWNGSFWTQPAVHITGDMIVNGTIAAEKINTNGLQIRDSSGNVIFGAGTQVPASLLQNSPGGNITNNSSTSTVRINGTPMTTADFVNRLMRISSTNIDTFMANAAIGGAHIGRLEVGAINIAGGAITAVGGDVKTNQVGPYAMGATQESTGLVSASVNIPAEHDNVVRTKVLIVATVSMGASARAAGLLRIRKGTAANQVIVTTHNTIETNGRFTVTAVGIDENPSVGTTTYYTTWTPMGVGGVEWTVFHRSITVQGIRR